MLDELQTMFISSQGRIYLSVSSCVCVTLLLPGFQACVYVEGGGGGNGYSNASIPCPLVGAMAYSSLFLFI